MRIPAIDGFRAYSILCVVALHLIFLSGALRAAGENAFALVTWGLLGNAIDAFLIISGFVLFLPVVRRGGELGSLSDYALGRATRLLPPYWLSIAVVLLLLAVVPLERPWQLGGSGELVPFPGASDVLAHLGALQMPARLVDSGVDVGFLVNGPVWLISVIVGFYVVFPFIARPYYRHPLLGLALAGLLTLGWREAALHLTGVFTALQGHGSPDWVVQLAVTDQLPGWAFSFALGMTGAWGFVRLRNREGAEVGRTALFVTAGGLAGCLVCAYLYGDRATELNASFSGSAARSAPLLVIAYSASRAALMAGIALGPLWLQRPFTGRTVRQLADVSYGLYLFHFVVALYIGMALLNLPTDGRPGSVALWFGVCIPISLAGAFLSARLVEKPLRRWARERRPAAGVGGRLA